MRQVAINQDGKVIGWFDSEKAERFAGARIHNGHNYLDINTRCQWASEELLRTAGGKWVVRHSNRCQGSEDYDKFIAPEEALKWLVYNDYDDAVDKYFPECPEEYWVEGPTYLYKGPTHLFEENT